MPIIKQSDSSFVPVPAGTHPARCYGMVSLGTQPPKNPTFKPSFQVVLLFELPNEQMEIAGERKPMSFSHFLNAYLGSPSKPSKTNAFLTAWRGKSFTEQELAGFDIAKVVGVPCLLGIIHEERNGKIVARTSSVSPLPKGMSMSKQINKSVLYEIEQGRDATFEALPEWMKKMISACIEWQQPPAIAETPEPDAEHDDVPF